MRLFFALPAPPEVQAAASRVIERLRGAGEVKWVDPPLLHLTLKFLGEVPEERLEEITKAAVETANTAANFVLECGGIGAFPHPRRPRVVWLGIGGAGAEKLGRLAESLDRRLAKVGFAREEREFRPHLTLGRVKGPKGLPDLAKRLEREAKGEPERVSWPVSELILVQSQLRRTGPIYTPVEHFSLRRPRAAEEEGTGPPAAAEDGD